MNEAKEKTSDPDFYHYFGPLSPVDCLLRHTHTPKEPITPLGALLQLTSGTSAECAPMKRPKNRLKPSLTLGHPKIHPNTSMVCLQRLKLNSIKYPMNYEKSNYEMFSDSPGARCKET